MIRTYIITHVASGAFYIGCTSNYISRKGDHESQLRCNRHPCKRLQDAYNINPSVSFTEYSHATIEDAYQHEFELMQSNNDNPLLLNVFVVPNLGNKFPSEETRIKMSNAKLGTVASEETRNRMSETRSGRPKTPEWFDKISEGKRLAVSVDGIKYRSIIEAANANNVSSQLAHYRFHSDGKKWTNWKIT